MKPNKLKKAELKRLQKKFPKVPKKRPCKKEIEHKQAIRKARVENMGLILIMIFFLAMTIAGFMIIYLMWNYKW